MALQRRIIQPHPSDNKFSTIPIDFDPDTLGWILDEGKNGNLGLQNELFDTMEDTWDRLRSDLNKLKRAVCKLPFLVQPWSEKGREPTPSAIEKASLVEHALHHQPSAAWEGRNNLYNTIYELLDAVARGISVVEIDWTVEDGRYLPLGTRRVPVSCLGFERREGAKDPTALRLFPDRDPNTPRPFTAYPHKFLVGIYKGKSGHLAGTGQLRALAPLWLGRMLGWEWALHKAELFGIPIRWATFDPIAPPDYNAEVFKALSNLGSDGWTAVPLGTDLHVVQGNTPGVAGPNEPTERIMAMADRSCDLIFLGQTLTTTQEGNRHASYALGGIHREVELDLYENYAGYVVDVINSQLIPDIIALNWGNTDELPFIDVDFYRPDRDMQNAQRDKLLFTEMGIPVAKQWLYDRHKIPAPGPGEDLFRPGRDS